MNRYADALYGISPGRGRGGEERLKEAEEVKAETDDRMAGIDEVLGIVAVDGANTRQTEAKPTPPAHTATESLLSEIDELV